jgi:LPS export ABC transporter permease LptG
MRPRVLDRYVLRFFWSSYAICLVTLVMLFVIGDLVSSLNQFSRPGVVWWRDIPRYYEGQLPLIFDRFGAFMTLAGAMFAVARLERNNELLPMKAGGVSIFRALAPVLVSAGLLGGATFLNSEVVIPSLADLIRESLRLERHGDVSPGILRDDRGNTLYARSYEPATQTLRWVTFREHDERGATLREVHADRAKWIPTSGRGGFWLVEDGFLRDAASPAPGGAPHVAERTIGRGVPRDLAAPAADEGSPLASTIRPIDIESLGERVSLLSLSDLADQYRRQRYLPSLRVQLHGRFTAPLTHVILCLIGIPLVLRASGQRSMFLGLLVVIVVCAAFFVATFIFQNLGRDGVLSAFYAAWVPTVVFALLGIALFDTVKT